MGFELKLSPEELERAFLAAVVSKTKIDTGVDFLFNFLWKFFC